MKNKNAWGIIIVSVILFVIRTAGIEDIPLPALGGIMMLCMITGFIMIKNYKMSKKEKSYLYSMITLITLLLGTVIVLDKLDEKYAGISNAYEPVCLSIIIVLFIGLSLVTLAYASYKSNFKPKK